MTTKKFCTKCGNPFIAIGREVICPACKAHADAVAKRAAVERAKRASWSGESVPVRISGRASTVIREYAAANGMAFAQALDALLKASDYFKSTGGKWEEVTPYKSRRRDKHATADNEQDAPQASKPQDAQDAQDAPQTAKAAKTTAKTSTAKKAAKTTAKGGKA